jgi:isoquinoline 1-oxidoreductase subunit alpha
MIPLPAGGRFTREENGMKEYVIKVNGVERRVQADGDTPLLWVLRDQLRLTGTKYGCGLGLCGSCTVHVDGRAEQACTIALEEVAEKPVLTIEGLARNPDHPVFKAWIRHEVSQCGYCQPGMIMTLAALLEENPRPSSKQLDDALSTVLCRCGTYPRVRKAAEELARGGPK